MRPEGWKITKFASQHILSSSFCLFNFAGVKQSCQTTRFLCREQFPPSYFAAVSSNDVFPTAPLRESRVATFLEFSFLINKVENILVNVQHVGLAASSGIMECCLNKGSVGETQRSSDDPCCPERDETGMVRAFPWWFCLVSSGLSGLD